MDGEVREHIEAEKTGGSEASGRAPDGTGNRVEGNALAEGASGSVGSIESHGDANPSTSTLLGAAPLPPPSLTASTPGSIGAKPPPLLAEAVQALAEAGSTVGEARVVEGKTVEKAVEDAKGNAEARNSVPVTLAEAERISRVIEIPDALQQEKPVETRPNEDKPGEKCSNEEKPVETRANEVKPANAITASSEEVMARSKSLSIVDDSEASQLPVLETDLKSYVDSKVACDDADESRAIRRNYLERVAAIPKSGSPQERERAELYQRLDRYGYIEESPIDATVPAEM